jgi:lysosomal Pro-X carboxypeptidase
LQLQQARWQQRLRQAASSPDATKLVPAAADGTDTTAGPFTVHYFPQELDHFTFTPNASTVFYQKYLVNDTFWRRPSGGSTGPLFVYTGGEIGIERIAINAGFMFDIAPKFGALLVFIEVQILVHAVEDNHLKADDTYLA